jgi:hypothetical protein
MHQLSMKMIIQSIVSYEKLEHVFNHFPLYHMNIMLGAFHEKGERRYLCTLYQILQGLLNKECRLG